jgi:hypothetical protein
MYVPSFLRLLLQFHIDLVTVLPEQAWSERCLYHTGAEYQTLIRGQTYVVTGALWDSLIPLNC